MENYNSETRVLTVGKTQFYIDGLLLWNKAKFKEVYVKHLDCDIDVVWLAVEKCIKLVNKANGSTGKPIKKSSKA